MLQYHEEETRPPRIALVISGVCLFFFLFSLGDYHRLENLGSDIVATTFFWPFSVVAVPCFFYGAAWALKACFGTAPKALVAPYSIVAGLSFPLVVLAVYRLVMGWSIYNH